MWGGLYYKWLKFLVILSTSQILNSECMLFLQSVKHYFQNSFLIFIVYIKPEGTMHTLSTVISTALI